tara:strand:- start:1211 stop:1471 length:261 start_codon:yes stop_codon:yes gene_type:complete
MKILSSILITLLVINFLLNFNLEKQETEIQRLQINYKKIEKEMRLIKINFAFLTRAENLRRLNQDYFFLQPYELSDVTISNEFLKK